jgi:hypothetical protein
MSLTILRDSQFLERIYDATSPQNFVYSTVDNFVQSGSQQSYDKEV